MNLPARELQGMLLIDIFVANQDETMLPSFLTAAYFSTSELEPFQMIKKLYAECRLNDVLGNVKIDSSKYASLLVKLAEADLDLSNVTAEQLIAVDGVPHSAADNFVSARFNLEKAE